MITDGLLTVFLWMTPASSTGATFIGFSDELATDSLPLSIGDASLQWGNSPAGLTSGSGLVDQGALYFNSESAEFVRVLHSLASRLAETEQELMPETASVLDDEFWNLIG